MVVIEGDGSGGVAGRRKVRAWGEQCLHWTDTANSTAESLSN